ncbi:MAG: hypothetical protein ACQESR_09390 [Planctomycetota bacterium]
MTRREKTLAAVVAMLVLLTGLVYGAKKVAAVLTTRSDRILELKEETDRKELLRHRGVVARRVLDEYADRSLPGDKQLANSRYRAWLHEWCQAANISRANVKYVSYQRGMLGTDHVHDKHTFSVNCEADLSQLVDLLHDFYSRDYLHRIKSCKVSAVEKEGRLAVSVLIEALALPGVPDRELGDMPSNRLALESVDRYYEVIVKRNPYAPANEPPRFASSGFEQGYVNRPISFTPRVEDPENGNLTYRVEHEGLENLTVDEETGRIEWTPEEVGEFEILVHAKDDGMPAKEASQTIRLAVTEPPPPEEGPPPKPTFDEAKYAFVTGIVEMGDKREVWITIRTAGEVLKLSEGDSFEVGSKTGKILKIHAQRVEVSCNGTVYMIPFGKTLCDGQELRSADDEVAVTGG